MDRHRHSALKQSTKTFKLTWFLALLVAGLLPYLLVKHFSGKVVIQEPEETTVAAETPVVPAPTNPVTQPVKPVTNDWTTMTTRPGDSLSTIFKRAGLSAKTLQQLMQNKKYSPILTKIKPNQPIQMLIKQQVLERMIVLANKTEVLDITLNGNQYQFILTKSVNGLTVGKQDSPKAVEPAPVVHTVKNESREEYLTATVQYSLYSTAKRHHIPYTLIQQMIDIFEWEIDFAKDVRGGDRFSIVYQAKYQGKQLVKTGDIIAVSYTSRGVSHKALRHVSTAGDVDYFTPEGKSLRQAFSRYPIKFSRINSPFSLSRMHPILHYNRPHKGVDLAAPMGTPIRATGDGRVEVLGYENGYGNVIKIAHHNKLYTSVSAHLLKFQKGIFQGVYVKRGQVIGYVGKSGLASGPHCHYEFHVNHRPKNPSTVPLPHAMPVPSRDLASFKAHADRLIDHLRLYEKSQTNSKNNHAIG